MRHSSSPVTDARPCAGVGHRRDLDRLLVERRRPIAAARRRRPVSARGGRRRSDGRAASAAASARRRARRGDRGRGPAAISASGSAALAYVSRGSGHGQCGVAPTRADRRDRVGEQAAGPRSGAGRRRAPRPRRARRTPSPGDAANAAPTPWSKYDDGAAGASTRRARGGRRCRTPRRCDPSSPRRRAGRASGRRRRAGCGCAPSTPCDVGEEAERSPAELVQLLGSGSGSRTTTISSRATSSVQ